MVLDLQRFSLQHCSWNGFIFNFKKVRNTGYVIMTLIDLAWNAFNYAIETYSQLIIWFIIIIVLLLVIEFILIFNKRILKKLPGIVPVEMQNKERLNK